MPKLAFAALISLVLSLVGCGGQPPPHYLVGIDLAAVTFTLTSENMGIYPDESVLDDPGNPFRHVPLDLEAKFFVGEQGSDAAGFYGWATVLARQPTGEHQFYTATKLQALYQKREVENRSLEPVRQMAIRAYQSVLDNFPDSVTYDASGTVAYRLAPPAFHGILGLGGTPDGGWVEVTTPDGKSTVVKGGGP